ncbi:hypothetical protein L7F22_021553 [Adiantum nelumboides]|nr:hypothetical protein [Adiantum nelumboides]
MGMERPQLVLGQQPPMPGHNAVPIKCMHPKGIIDEQELVPVTPYVEPSPSTIMAKGGWFNPYPPPIEESIYYAQPEPSPMYFVANQGVRPPMGRPMIKPKTGNCYNCGVDDNWKNECPMPDKNIKPVEPFCTKCCKKGGHFPKDCAKNPMNKQKAMVDVVEVILSSSTKSEPIVPVKVITRAQAKKKKHNSFDESKSTKSSSQRAKKRRSQRYELRKQKQQEQIEKKSKKLFQEKEKKSEGEIKETSIISGGFILVDKIFELINAALEAFQAGHKAGQNMENKWKNYPSSDMEAAKLDAYQNLSLLGVRPMIDYVPWELHVGDASMPIVEELVNKDEPFVKESLYGKKVADAKHLVQLEEVEPVLVECLYKKVADCGQVVGAESLRLDDESGHDDGPTFVKQLGDDGADIESAYGEDDEVTSWSFKEMSKEDRDTSWEIESEERMLVKVKLPCYIHEAVVVATMNEEQERVSKLGSKDMQVRVLCGIMLVMMLVKVAIEGAWIVEQVQGFPKKRRVVVTNEAKQVEEDGRQEAFDAHQREGKLQLPMDCTRDTLDTGSLEQICMDDEVEWGFDDVELSCSLAFCVTGLLCRLALPLSVIHLPRDPSHESDQQASVSVRHHPCGMPTHFIRATFLCETFN